MNFFAKVVVGFAALLGMAVSVPMAHAATYGLSGADIASAYTNDGFYVSQNVARGVFSDSFSFTTLSGGATDSSVANLYASFNKKGVTTVTANITGLSLTLESASGGILATSVYDSGSASYSLSYANLLANTAYKLVVSGNGVGSNGGTYGLSVGISAVPIPGALVLFGSGFVMLGAIARKKKRNSSM